MAKDSIKLSDKTIKALKPEEKTQYFFDAEGLYLEVTPKGGKYWRLKYRFEGKDKRKSLGTYPSTTLADARKKKAKAKGDVANGRDPFQKEVKEVTGTVTAADWKVSFSKYKKLLKELQDKETTDKRIAAVKKAKDLLAKELFTDMTTFEQWTEWYFMHVGDSLSDSHLNRTRKGWNKDVIPAVGTVAMGDISTGDVVNILRDMKERDAPESARKVYGSIKKLYSLVISNYPDSVSNNPCGGINVSDVIGKKQETHYPVMTDEKELKALFATIDEYGGDTSTKRALQLLPYVFTRPANIRFAEWKEFDLKKKQWVIPASKLKTKKELIVPLATQVVDMLLEWQQDAVSDLLFPSPRSKTSALSDVALVGALRRMGYNRTEIVAHSFRGIFSTISHEKSKFSHDAIETQLAHSVGSSVSQAYNRSQYLAERVEMMQWYANHLDGIKNG